MVGNRLRAGALVIAVLPTLAQWIIMSGPRPAFTLGPPTSAGVDDLIKALGLWYVVIVLAIPAVIALVPLLFSLRSVVLVAALLMSAGSAYTFVLSDWFISWGFRIGWGLYSTFGPVLAAFAVCYALSAGLLFAASGNPGNGVFRSP